MSLSYSAEGPILFTLEWCPTVNHYWLTHKNYKYISQKGREFRKSVNRIVALNPDHKKFYSKKLAIHIIANPPDSRKRDLDNLLKAPLDALQNAGVYKDDNQIEEIIIRRGEKGRPGSLDIRLWRVFV